MGQYEPELNPKLAEIRQRQAAGEQVKAMLYAVGGIAAVEAWEKAADTGKDEGNRQAARRANKDFTQVTQAGWEKLDEIVQKDKNAARLFAFFCKHMGPDGAVTASRTTIAEALEITERTVTRYVKTLVELNALVVLKVGTANVYCLNPEQVWKSFNNAKPYAAFNTKTLVGKSENPFIKRRLTTLLNGKEPVQKDMFDDNESMSVDWSEANAEDFDGDVSIYQKAAE